MIIEFIPLTHCGQWRYTSMLIQSYYVITQHLVNLPDVIFGRLDAGWVSHHISVMTMSYINLLTALDTIARYMYIH